MESFVKLFENLPSFSLKGKSLEERYYALGIDEKFVFTKSRVDEELTKRIVAALTPSSSEGFIRRSDINSLRDAFYYADKLNDTQTYKLYFDTLQYLNSVCGNSIPKYPVFIEVAKWQEAIMYLNTLRELYDKDVCLDEDFGLEKQRDRIDAVKRLRKHGITAKIANNDIELTDIDKVTKLISSNVEKIGGVRFINILLSQLPYDKVFDRVIFPKQGNTANYNDIHPETPIAYLFNVGMSKTMYKGKDKYDKDFLSTVQLATDLCTALYPVQSYSIWEDVFGADIDPDGCFRKWAIWDSIYNIPQSGVPFMIDLVKYISDKLHREGRQMSDKYTLPDYAAVMKDLVSLANEKSFKQIDPSSLNILDSKEKQSIIIGDITADSVNLSYKSPLDYDKVTYSDFPAFKLPNGNIFLYPASIGVMAWYEVMMSKLREQDEIYLAKQKEKGNKVKYQGADNLVGLILEDYVRHRLLEKTIDSKSGKYTVDKEDGECDVFVENADTILLMEMKKKNMTRRSREGYLYQIILDYAGSLFNSQEQAFRTETFLKRKGTIELDDNGTKTSLEYNGRKCEKVTITLNEYGPLHERVIIGALMKNFMKYHYTVEQSEIERIESDPDKVKRIVQGFKSLKKKQDLLAEYLTELSQSVADKSFIPFFDSWFFSIEQFCYIISQSSDVDELMNNISSLKYCSFGIKDFWQEVNIKLGMKS